jgi:hypothetical protein
MTKIYHQAKAKSLEYILWVVMLPVAIVAAGIARALVVLAYKIGMAYAYITPESFLYSAFLLLMTITASFVFGVVFVYVAGRIAPKYKENTVYAMLCLGLVVSGAILSSVFFLQDWENVWSVAFVVVGMIALTYSVYKGKIDLSSKL